MVDFQAQTEDVNGVIFERSDEDASCVLIHLYCLLH